MAMHCRFLPHHAYDSGSLARGRRRATRFHDELEASANTGAQAEILCVAEGSPGGICVF